jgi:hypothetical protein
MYVLYVYNRMYCIDFILFLKVLRTCSDVCMGIFLELVLRLVYVEEVELLVLDRPLRPASRWTQTVLGLHTYTHTYILHTNIHTNIHT